MRFVLAEDRAGTAFRFAPLQGETFAARVPAEMRRLLPDSLVVLTEGGETLVRSAAVLYVLGRLGGLWWPLASGIGVLPARLHHLRAARH